MTRSNARRVSRLLASVALLGLGALSAAGCSSASLNSGGGALGGGGLFAARSSGGSEATRNVDDWRQEADASGERYRANPRDPDAAIRYALALRKSGQRAQASAVLEQASIHHPNNRKLLGAYGRALADVGNLPQALEVLGRAHTPDQPDWRILSAQGAVLDQMGRYDEARRYYNTALKIAPDEPVVLSNLGLSYALSKDLAQAETTLRRAAERAGTERRVRQNLALVVGLRGRFHEAQEIARADLPPDQAAENVSYLRTMLAQHEGRGARGGTVAQGGTSAKAGTTARSSKPMDLSRAAERPKPAERPKAAGAPKPAPAKAAEAAEAPPPAEAAQVARAEPSG